MIRPILDYKQAGDHSVLRQKAEPVIAFNEHLEALVQDMADTLYANKGIGLAANQIGVAQRVLLIDLNPESGSRQSLNVFVNPVLLKGKGAVQSEEGCLSLPSYRQVRPIRYKRIEVAYQDLMGRPGRLKTDGLMSICLQHEMDHLDGVLMIDRTAQTEPGVSVLRQQEALPI